VPAGKNTVPPPTAVAASIALLMAGESSALPSPLAPKARTLNTFGPTGAAEVIFLLPCANVRLVQPEGARLINISNRIFTATVTCLVIDVVFNVNGVFILSKLAKDSHEKLCKIKKCLANVTDKN